LLSRRIRKQPLTFLAELEQIYILASLQFVDDQSTRNNRRFCWATAPERLEALCASKQYALAIANQGFIGMRHGANRAIDS
jgi:hypothetical protein